MMSKKNLLSRLTTMAEALLLVGLTCAMAGCHSGNREPMPADEARFIAKVSSFVSDYNSAPNTLVKSTLRATRGEELRKILPEMNFAGWVGTLKDVTTTSGGDVAVAIELPGSVITVQTLTKTFADVSAHTLIPHDSPLVGQVTALAKGDKVNFDGSFILDGIDWIKELSANEHDSMTKPDYLVRFKEITKKQ
jgi:hypothetical protein